MKKIIWLPMFFVIFFLIFSCGGDKETTIDSSAITAESMGILEKFFKKQELDSVLIEYEQFKNSQLYVKYKNLEDYNPTVLGLKDDQKAKYVVFLNKNIMDINSCEGLGLIGHEIYLCLKKQRENQAMYDNFLKTYGSPIEERPIKGESAGDKLVKNARDVQAKIFNNCKYDL